MFKKYFVSEIGESPAGPLFSVYTRDQSVFDLIVDHKLPASISVATDLSRSNEAKLYVWVGMTCNNPEAMRQQMIADIEAVLNPPPTDEPDLGAFKGAIDDLDLGDLDQ